MRLVAISVVALAYSSSAYAALDELLPAASNEVASVQIAGHALRVRTRVHVKEFAGSDGKVFAAVWQGTAAPDLHALLGSYYAEYETARSARRSTGHHHLFLRTPALEVNVISEGQFIAGSVFLTKKLPKGVTVDALR